MISLKQFWNGKLIGIPGLFGIIISRLIQLLNDILYSLIIKRNLGNTGKNIKILRGFKYRYPKNISLGNNVTIGNDVIFTTELDNGKLTINDNVTIGRKCQIDFSGNVTIGNGSLLSEGTIIQSHDHGLNPRSKPVARQLIIEENVWIATNVLILSNVKKIGKNSIIAAGAVVTKEIPANCIAAGVPAKIIRKDIPTK